MYDLQTLTSYLKAEIFVLGKDENDYELDLEYQTRDSQCGESVGYFPSPHGLLT